MKTPLAAGDGGENLMQPVRRGRPLSQGAPSPKTVHRTVLGFTPCGGIMSKVFRALRSATRDSVSGLCQPLKRLDRNFALFCKTFSVFIDCMPRTGDPGALPRI